MGGMHTALADDITTLFSNPAGFRSAGPEPTPSPSLTVGLTGPVFSIADLIVQAVSSGAELVDMLSSGVETHGSLPERTVHRCHPRWPPFVRIRGRWARLRHLQLLWNRALDPRHGAHDHRGDAGGHRVPPRDTRCSAFLCRRSWRAPLASAS
ncbi:MAG: hypothetical protein MZV64_28675 [Ignavibacteriales bacterium]|nr:hypothetical protein [Ignavibacteriales bacterium]